MFSPERIASAHHAEAVLLKEGGRMRWKVCGSGDRGARIARETASL
jgi:hypothetical protein